MTSITSEEILVGNKLIATFMGYTFYPYSNSPTYENDPGWKLYPNTKKYLGSKLGRKDEYLCRKHQELPFYNDWEWLHKILKRISETGASYQISQLGCYIGHTCCHFGHIDDNLRVATFRTLIDYINWYNENHN